MKFCAAKIPRFQAVYACVYVGFQTVKEFPIIAPISGEIIIFDKKTTSTELYKNIKISTNTIHQWIKNIEILERSRSKKTKIDEKFKKLKILIIHKKN